MTAKRDVLLLVRDVGGRCGGTAPAEAANDVRGNRNGCNGPVRERLQSADGPCSVAHRSILCEPDAPDDEQRYEVEPDSLG